MEFDLEKERKQAKAKKIVLEVLRWAVEVAAVVFAAYFIINVALERTVMLGDSMNPALMADEKIIISKFAYKLKQPKRFDVIVFKQSGNEHSYYNIKRVVGLPGETVQIKDGFLYINGEILNEPMVTEEIKLPGLAEEAFTLDEDEYFVLGDNRNNSEDSRFVNIGNVVKSDIVGKAWIRLKPFNFISKLNMYDKKEEIPEN